MVDALSRRVGDSGDLEKYSKERMAQLHSILVVKPLWLTKVTKSYNEES